MEASEFNSDIKLALSTEEREAIYRFRYRIFIEELGKLHIEADHERRFLFDEADELASLFFVPNGGGDIVATVRAIGGSNAFFPKYAYDLFNLKIFEENFPKSELGISDKIMVDPIFRNQRIGDKLHQACYIQGIEWGTKICFCACDDSVLLMYFHYGWRAYAEPEILSNGKKRHRLILLLNDNAWLKKLNSPYLKHLPEGLDNGEEYVGKLKEKLGITLFSLVY